VRLSSVDLNSLRILDALLEEGSVTGASKRLGVTQSAVSHALARLREQFGDPLFVRTSKGVTPTARAEELRAPIRRGLDALREAIEGGARFVPKTAQRSFTMAMTDQLGATLLPAVCREIASSAPHVDLRVTPVVRNVERMLETAAADVVVLGASEPPEAPGLFRQRLFEEDLVCVVRAEHPLARREALTLDQFCSLSHVLVAPQGGQHAGVVNAALARQGQSRRIAVMVPHFLVAPYVVAVSDLVLTVAASVARTLAPMLGLRVLAPPIELPRAAYWQIWHERTHGDASQKWLRALVAKVGASHAEQPAPRAGARQARARS
jgi:DNA-binding transcriptional LysR family regulator